MLFVSITYEGIKAFGFLRWKVFRYCCSHEPSEFFQYFRISNRSAISSAYKHISEEGLIVALKSKDRDALEYLYDHYSGALLGVIARILKKEELAEEVLQDVFLKIWDRIASYDASKGKLFTWMLNIARN